MATTQQQAYCNYLTAEGFPVIRIDEDGEVIFKCEGRTYVIPAHEDRPERFSLLFPCFWAVEDAQEARLALAVCSEVNARVHGAKLFIAELEGRREVCAVAELFLRTPVEDMPSVFYHCLKAIQAAVYAFVARMHAAQATRPLPVASATISAEAGNGGGNGGYL